jgi:uncharacterized protein
MRVLFDINHPAQVHLFKTVISRLKAEGHAVLVASRDKDVCLDLLDRLGVEHVCLSRIGKGATGLGRELLVRYWRIFRLARRFKPDVMVSRGGIFIGLPGAVLRIPRIVFEDTEHARVERMLSLPFATWICTGTGYMCDHGKRQIRHRGVQHFAHLDPRYFQPSREPLLQAGVDPDAPYIVLRVVAWGAGHDLGLSSTSETMLAETVRRLSKFGRVLLSSEKPLPACLAAYRNPVPSDHMHDLLAFAALFIGEGGTMAAEAGILGVPAVFTSPLLPGCQRALEQDYQLIRCVPTMAEGLPIAEQWLAMSDLRAVWQQRRQRLLADSEDIPVFIYNIIRKTCQERRHGDSQVR